MSSVSSRSSFFLFLCGDWWPAVSLGGGGRRADAVARAGDEVVVGEPDGLHEGVEHGGAHEPEASPDHVLADGLRLGRLHRDRSHSPTKVERT